MGCNAIRTDSWSNDWKTVEIPCEIKGGADTLVLKTSGESVPNLDEGEFR